MFLNNQHFYDKKLLRIYYMIRGKGEQKVHITPCMWSFVSHSCRIYEQKVRIYSTYCTKSATMFRIIAVYTQ